MSTPETNAERDARLAAERDAVTRCPHGFIIDAPEDCPAPAGTNEQAGAQAAGTIAAAVVELQRRVIDARRRAGRTTTTPQQRALYHARIRGHVDALVILTRESRVTVVEELDALYLAATEA